MLGCCSTNRTDIKNRSGDTAAVQARNSRYSDLANYVDQFQSGPRGKVGRPLAVDVHSLINGSCVKSCIIQAIVARH